MLKGCRGRHRGALWRARSSSAIGGRTSLGTAAAQPASGRRVEAWYDAQVGAGQDWRIATAKALEASRIFVLLFSENAAQSSDIAKELAAATLEKKLIIPVRLQNIAPKGAFLYELASRNWVNAYEDTEAKLAELAKGLAHLVRTGARDESVLPFDRTESSASPPRRRRGRPHRRGRRCVVMAAAAGLFWLYPRPAIAGPARGRARRGAAFRYAERWPAGAPLRRRAHR